MNIFFELLCIIHIAIWIFILLAFVNKKTAEINLYYLIPFIYVIHILPFHIIVKLKHIVEPEDTDKKVKDYESSNIFANALFNPLSPQGMMILGAITSAWAIKN